MAQIDTATWPPWQLPYEHGMLVIWPPNIERQYINAFRAKHDPVSQEICDAHVTVSQPFLSAPTDATWAAISDVVASFHRFDLQYGPVRSFLPAPVIWLEVQPSSTILALRNALHDTEVFDLTLPHTDDFIVHMTLTEGLSGDDVDQTLLDRLKSEVNAGSFACSEIAYVQPNDAFHFSVRRVIPLGAI